METDVGDVRRHPGQIAEDPTAHPDVREAQRGEQEDERARRDEPFADGAAVTDDGQLGEEQENREDGAILLRQHRCDETRRDA